jgi:Protein of unknown function (DUF4058)
MPLHDWSGRPGWEGMHQLWIVELLRWIKPRLPEGYRAYIGSAPVLAVGAPSGRPDVSVGRLNPQTVVQDAPRSTPRPPLSTDAKIEPDIELAVATLDPVTSLWIEKQGRLISAVELISPRNKDRPASRDAYLSRYLGYLLESVHLLLIDVHRQPLGFSFADRIAADLAIAQAPLPAPLAVTYRIGEPAATTGRLLAIWRRALQIGTPLPTLPLPLDLEHEILVDLEQTYTNAAADAYVDSFP